ncbi:MAG: SDR family NAD(P)-dependent oxidoreductase [bacterium]
MLENLWNTLLDRSILWSFDRSGFERHARDFRRSDIPADCSGLVCLVTGANSGIGYAAAEALAQRGARVWLLCRDRLRGESAVRALRQQTGNADLHFAPLDLADLDSVRRAVAHLKMPRVDVLVHNAGILPETREITADGLELTLATNVAGPFLLTRLLWSRLLAAPAGRVIFVSSGGMYGTRLSLDDLDWRRRSFDGVAAYAQTKRMQVVLTELFAARAAPTPLSIHAMHPGWADTPAVRTSLPRFHHWMRNRLRTPEQGADTLVWLALSSRLKPRSGAFWFDRTAQPTHLLRLTRERDGDRERLWQLCETWTGLAETPARAAAAG